MNVYAVVTPFVLLLIAAEVIFCLKRKNGYYEFQDSIASMGTAVMNQCVNVVVAMAWLPVLAWLYAHKLFTFEPGVASSLALFFGVDFLFYWFHRFGHRTNIGWAAHAPHHSTEELNYAVALRASVTQRFASFFFYWPLALLGFEPMAVVSMVAFHLVLQLIPHTRVVPKLPRFIESWMNTPSHHRVHHARNPQYLDKNYGGFLIIWDKLFGSFEPEGEAPEYGITTPPNTWDPNVINFMLWRQLFKDAWNAPKKIDALKVWFKQTGWRPEGLPAWPKRETSVKFRSTPLPGSTAYLFFAVVMVIPHMLLVTRHDSPLTGVEKIMLSLLLWAGATAWGGILESKRWAPWLEGARLVGTAALLASFSVWAAAACIAAAVWAVVMPHGRALAAPEAAARSR
ncbi:MAG: sterol desaturase family protein [Myxococcaceae bacterium]|nr:sterol desaturase family protein [Myxococcaceae bacterium]